MHWRYILWRIKSLIREDQQLLEDGRIIPCSVCGKDFFSYCHYNGNNITFDCKCVICRGDKDGQKSETKIEPIT